MTFIEPDLISIAAGPVTLGAPVAPSDGSFPHRWKGPRSVAVGAFEIARNPVTRREYELFLKDSKPELPVDWGDPALQDPRQPVCGVSACDADTYCRWLSEKSGRRYRLPHADEWEKAARGGLEGKKFPWGDDDPKALACFGGTEKEAPRSVGSYPANGYGLNDMVGNVWQWLADLYREVAADEPKNTPTGKPAALNRVLVGGSFMTGNEKFLWVAYRHEDPPDLRHRCLGFRLARE